jgi:hypothetical protein
MSNLFRSLSSLIGVKPDGRAAPSEAVSGAAAPHVEAEPASGGDATLRHDVLQAPRGSTLDLPLVAYAPPRGEDAAPRRRSRSISLLRSTTPAAMTSRTVPTLPSVAVRHNAQPAGPLLTETERVRLQVMQAQIQLSAMRLYDGPIDGHMGSATVQAVRYFQTLKGIRATGLLAVGTLASLGVPLIG